MNNPSDWSHLPIDIKRWILVFLVAGTIEARGRLRSTVKRCTLVCREFYEIFRSRETWRIIRSFTGYPPMRFKVKKADKNMHMLPDAWMPYAAHSTPTYTTYTLTPNYIVTKKRQNQITVHSRATSSVVYDDALDHSYLATETSIGLIFHSFKTIRLLKDSKFIDIEQGRLSYARIFYNGIYDDQSYMTWNDAMNARQDLTPQSECCRTLLAKTVRVIRSGTSISIMVSSHSNLTAYDEYNDEILWTMPWNNDLFTGITVIDNLVITLTAKIYDLYTGKLLFDQPRIWAVLRAEGCYEVVIA